MLATSRVGSRSRSRSIGSIVLVQKDYGYLSDLIEPGVCDAKAVSIVPVQPGAVRAITIPAPKQAEEETYESCEETLVASPSSASSVSSEYDDDVEEWAPGFGPRDPKRNAIYNLNISALDRFEPVLAPSPTSTTKKYQICDMLHEIESGTKRISKQQKHGSRELAAGVGFEMRRAANCASSITQLLEDDRMDASELQRRDVDLLDDLEKACAGLKRTVGIVAEMERGVLVHDCLLSEYVGNQVQKLFKLAARLAMAVPFGVDEEDVDEGMEANREMLEGWMRELGERGRTRIRRVDSVV